MTVIVYRDGVMAADSAVWIGGIIVGNTKKIWRLSDGSLYAASGARPDVMACCRWLATGGMPHEKPAAVDDKEFFGALLVSSNGVIGKIDRRFELYDASCAKWAVEGAHSEFLLGALMQGATAEEAVSLAIQYGDSAGGEVQVERL